MRDARTGIPASFPLAITDTGIMETTFNILQAGYLEMLRRQAHVLIDLLSETSRMHAPTIEKKAAKALQFSVKKDADSLAIPSKVRGVSQYQDAVNRIVKQREAGRLRTVSMGQLEKVSAKRFAVKARTASGTFHYVGYVHTKHTGWIAKLAQHGPIDCYILQANGKDRKGYTGLSIAFTHVGEALGRWAAAQGMPEDGREAGDSNRIDGRDDGAARPRTRAGSDPHEARQHRRSHDLLNRSRQAANRRPEKAESKPSHNPESEASHRGKPGRKPSRTTRRKRPPNKGANPPPKTAPKRARKRARKQRQNGPENGPVRSHRRAGAGGTADPRRNRK